MGLRGQWCTSIIFAIKPRVDGSIKLQKTMKSILSLIVFLFMGTPKALAQIDSYDSIQVGGIWRTFNVHLPPGYSSGNSYPLVLGFHGGQQAATSALGWMVWANQSRLSEKANLEGFIAVYPEGRVLNQNRSWNAGECCPSAMNQNVDDVGFVNALLDFLFQAYAIDTTRVYATGSSNGGMMCYRLACELSHRLAAVAPNACAQMFYPCNPNYAVPIIGFHSKVDPIVPYNGGMGGASPLTTIYFPSQDSTLDFWTQQNGCQFRDTVVNGNGNNYDFIKISNCSCNVEIHHYATSDGSHSWPGGNPNNNPVSTQINATNLLWSFFQNYTVGCTPTGIGQQGKAISKHSVYPNPFSCNLRLKHATGKENCMLISCMGEVIWQGTNIGDQDFKNLTAGLYLLKIDNEVVKVVKD